MYKIDLHCHSILSKDGSLTIDNYKDVIEKGLLDYIAITDHNEIYLAKKAQDLIGDKIIIGEEIMTTGGEIIGLYLNKKIEPGMSIKKTINEIKKQDGIVYVPHPFDNLRHGLTEKDVLSNLVDVDILEFYNSRSLQFNNGQTNYRWAQKYKLLAVASSDSHGRIGFGKTKTILSQKPNRTNMLILLKEAKYVCRSSGFIARLYPSINRLRSSN